ncbi:uncharacterized protein LODBEIA_P03230 [Lodderomyces beijingensis]|uniref:BZIP domain-containing protein n=1 Tax=Lodderomyces beijingensis TaxID=1775926 RepID=A0ABP0ZD40_9ASCO
MNTRGPSIAPRQIGTSSSTQPIAIAHSPNNNNNTNSSSTGSTPSSIAGSSPANPASPPTDDISIRMQGHTTSSITTSIMTSKEWVLPPRPKPGRKPSVDTPASKRKAQNRAAQRAFRERRATRVQELEQKLMEVGKEKEVKEMALISTINKLKAENHFLTKNMEQLRQDMNEMKLQMEQSSSSQVGGAMSHAQTRHHNVLSSTHHQHQHQQHQQHQQKQHQQLRNSTETNATISPSNNSISPTGSSYSLQQISPAPSADSPQNITLYTSHSHSHSQQYNNRNSNQIMTPSSNKTTPDKLLLPANPNAEIDASNFDCGVCVKEECLCESVGLKEPSKNPTDSQTQLEQQLKSFKPEPAVSLKRKRKAPGVDEVKEVDFTRQFATKSKPMPDLKKLKKNTTSNKTDGTTATASHTSSSFNEDSPMENCGFCSDDTPCVCREAAKEAARLNASLNSNIIVEEEEGEEQDDDGHDEGIVEFGRGHHSRTLPPIQFTQGSRKLSLPVMHPGPSVEIREITNLTPGAVPTVIARTQDPMQAIQTVIVEEQQQEQAQTQTQTREQEQDNDGEDGGCTGNPGACKQCQMDPMSTLFCTTVASKSSELSSVRPHSSRTSSKTSMSLQLNLPNAPPPPPPTTSINGDAPSPIPPPLLASGTFINNSTSGPSTPSATGLSGGAGAGAGGMFIPCADAYKTLSRHKKFNSVDFSTLVGKLTTRGMQVEVQSVANVLRELDRRLYN